MKVKSINQFNVKDDLKLTKQQMKVIKGGDAGADVFVNHASSLTTLSFNG